MAERPKGPFPSRTRLPVAFHRELPPGMKGVASLCEAMGLSDSLCELVNMASVSSATSVLRKGEGCRAKPTLQVERIQIKQRKAVFQTWRELQSEPEPLARR